MARSRLEQPRSGHRIPADRSIDPAFPQRPALRRVLQEGRPPDDDDGESDGRPGREGEQDVSRSLFAELKRRNVIRTAGLYFVGAWLIVQVTGTVLPMFGAPDWLPRSIVLLMVIGFLPALAFAWI